MPHRGSEAQLRRCVSIRAPPRRLGCLFILSNLRKLSSVPRSEMPVRGNVVGGASPKCLQEPGRPPQTRVDSRGLRPPRKPPGIEPLHPKVTRHRQFAFRRPTEFDSPRLHQLATRIASGLGTLRGASPRCLQRSDLGETPGALCSSSRPRSRRRMAPSRAAGERCIAQRPRKNRDPVVEAPIFRPTHLGGQCDDRRAWRGSSWRTST